MLEKLKFWGNTQGPQNPVAVNANGGPDKKVDAVKVDAVAKKSIPEIHKQPTSDKVRNWTKANLPRVAYVAAFVAAAALITAGILTGGAVSPFAIAGYALAGTALLGAGIYETAKKRNLDSLAKDFYQSVIDVDKAQTPNEKATAVTRYNSARDNLASFVSKNASKAKDLEVLAGRIARANGNKHFRIDTKDDRYGADANLRVTTGAGITFEGLVEDTIISPFRETTQKDYDEAIASSSKKIAGILKNNISEASKVRYDLYQKAYDLANDPKFRILSKDQDSVMKDLMQSVRKELGDKTISKELAKMEGIMKDRLQFWDQVNAYRKEVKNEFSKKYNMLNLDIKVLDKELMKLKAELKKLDNERPHLLRVLRGDDDPTNAMIEKARARLPEIDAKMVELNNKKAEILARKEELKQEQQEKEKIIAEDYARNVNAKRQHLAALLGKDVEDLAMPANPNWKDYSLRWGKRAAVVGLVAGAGYGAYRVATIPQVADGVWAVGSVAGERVSPYAMAVAGKARNVYGYASDKGSKVYGYGASALGAVGSWFKGLRSDVVNKYRSTDGFKEREFYRGQKAWDEMTKGYRESRELKDRLAQEFSPNTDQAPFPAASPKPMINRLARAIGLA